MLPIDAPDQAYQWQPQQKRDQVSYRAAYQGHALVVVAQKLFSILASGQHADRPGAPPPSSLRRVVVLIIHKPSDRYAGRACMHVPTPPTKCNPRANHYISPYWSAM